MSGSEGEQGSEGEAYAPNLLLRFAAHGDTIALTVGGPHADDHSRGVPSPSPFHRPAPRPAYTLFAENRSDRAGVVALSVEAVIGLPDAAPRFSTDWAEWRLPPPPPEPEAGGVDALSADCRELTLLLMPGATREIALELLPACRRALAGDYRFAVGGREVVPAGSAADAARIRPAVGSLRLSHPDSTLLALLPEVYATAARTERERTPDGLPSFGERFLLGFGEMTDLLDHDIGFLPELFGVDTAPEEWLRWLATWVGLTLDDRWPEMRRRELIRHAITLYRRRGTVGGLADYLHLFTGVRPQISDAPVSGMRLGSEARLGTPGAKLGHIAPHTFVVTLSPGRAPLADQNAETGDEALIWDGVTLAALHNIIAASKPAHTAYALRVLRDGATPVAVQSVSDPSLTDPSLTDPSVSESDAP